MSSMLSAEAEYDINELDQEAKIRWLKPAEVYFILQNHEKYKITQEPPKQPSSGSLFLFNKRVLRFFRRDGHNWRKKKDGRTVGEAHERLKVGNVETLNCYYAHGEVNNNFQRRCYWMLDPAYEHIVLVHYRDINEGNPSSVSFGQLSPGSLLSFSKSPSPTTHNAGLSVSDYQSLTSPSSVEVSSNTVVQRNRAENRNSTSGSIELGDSTKVEVSHALRKLEEQLSLNDDGLQELGVEEPKVSDLMGYKDEVFNQDQLADFRGAQNVLQSNYYGGYNGGSGEVRHQYTGHEYSYERKESLSWKDVLDSCNTSSVACRQNDLSFNGNEPEFTRTGSTEEPKHHQWQTSSASSVDRASPPMTQEVNSFNFSQYPSTSGMGSGGTNSEYYGMLFNQGQIGPFESDLSLTVAQKQKFKIKEISPGWGYASESTKIIIVGSFLCDSSESTWNCMFGDVEVPVQIIQEGVLHCEAPPRPTGKVTLCVTSGNRESCSEIREFEYRLKPGGYAEPNSSPPESTRSPEELLFLVKFVQMLLSNSPAKKKDMADIDSYASVIEGLTFGGATSASTVDWLLEELLKDKLQNWISSKSWERQHDNHTGCPLSKKEQGIIHLVAGLGFGWALNPILGSGVSVNFRDIKGWTALHWAARFGREKMVAALMASGASAGAVTDPTSEHRTGETPASIAANSGHKGLAGYLSEVALTSHLSSLTLRESELSRDSAEVEAEITVNNISTQSLVVDHGDHVSLKHTLAAVRNAAQAAARIQSAFRAHSFRRRQARNASVSSIDEYGINADDIHELSAMSKLNFPRNSRDHNSAALSIQKKYRGYKGRKDYLTFRQNVVKIQAYVRGYQVRKHYKVICWAVGILEKVVLRWRRKGHGLRGFRPETDCVDESEDEDEDILKAFRKQKVDGTIKQAIARVLSMVKSSEAREQYHRVLEKYCQAKAELGGTSNEAVDISELYDDMEDINMYPYPFPQ